jgi:hypothetical protein
MLGLSFLESFIFTILIVPLIMMMAGIVLLPLYIIYSLIKEIFSNPLYFRRSKGLII